MRVIFFLTVINSCASALDPGLRVKFNIGLNPGVDFFFDVPRTLSSALVQRWRYTERADGPLPTLELYCPDDRVVCALFDDTGYIAGLQIALSQDNFTGAVFDWGTQGYKEWAPSVSTGRTIKYWITSQYFISEEALKKSAAKRIAARDDTKLLQHGAVWVTGFKGKLVQISTKTADIAASDFTIQACYPWMGRHYYYKMSKKTTCNAESMLPWFPLVYSGELIATGFISFGQLPIVDGQRDWFERATRDVVETIVPDGPTCLYNLADYPGILTMHIYYIESPWLVYCFLQ